ncbi:MAG: LamG-like jellyroll fold domain-containing protein, partial [Planctomycetota bacterium]
MFRHHCAFIAFLLSLGSIAVADEIEPVIRFSFESDLPTTSIGAASIQEGLLRSPRYPDFPSSNRVLELEAPAYLRLPDSGGSQFDFDHGDAVTFEAWIRLDRVGDNIAIVSKGRTGRSGYKSINQNWAFRLRKHGGLACPNFLFRSRDGEDHVGDWHRWTATDGFAAGPRWHHVALRYEFGKPGSIVAFVDGRKVDGKWDMGGATDQPPIVDDDDVLVGSTMDGHVGNSLDGAIDNLAIYRELVPDEVLAARYRRIPIEVTPPNLIA